MSTTTRARLLSGGSVSNVRTYGQGSYAFGSYGEVSEAVTTTTSETLAIPVLFGVAIGAGRQYGELNYGEERYG